jgi:hypothetical protein
VSHEVITKTAILLAINTVNPEILPHFAVLSL